MTVDYYSKLDAVAIKKARDELGETDQRRQQSIQIIREWYKKQPHFPQHPPLTDEMILAFLRGCKYSLEKTKSKLDMSLTMRGAIPEFFRGWNPFRPELQAALATGAILPLLDYDQLGRKVIIMRPGCFNAYLHKAEDIEKVSFMVLEIMGLEEEQMFITGMVVIVDLEGYSLSHVTQRPLSVTKKQMKYLQDATPLSPKSLNFIKTSPMFGSAYELVSTFINDKIKKRFKLHGDDMNSLFKEIDRKILPSDYGGQGLSISELTAHWKKQAEDNSKLLMEREKFYADESKRPGKPKTAQELFGIEGSFRKLEID